MTDRQKNVEQRPFSELLPERIFLQRQRQCSGPRCVLLLPLNTLLGFPLSRRMLRPPFGPQGHIVQFGHPLRFVHGGVRMLKKLLGLLPIVREYGDAQAGTN